MPLNVRAILPEPLTSIKRFDRLSTTSKPSGVGTVFALFSPV